MANRTFYLGLMSGQTATVKVYKSDSEYTSDVSSMTALLSGNSLTTTFQEITMDEDHYLYFYDGSSLISMWYPDSSTSNNTSGNLVSAYIENDGNYVFDTRYRGLHLDAGNPSGGGSASTVAPAFTFTLTTDSANSEEAVVYGMYVRHPSGSGSNYQTEEITATAGSNATATLPDAKAFSGQTHYLHYFKVYNGDADPGEYSYQYNTDHLAKHPTKASGSMAATGTGTVDQTQPGSPGQITLTFSSGSVSTTPAGNYNRTHNYQPGYPDGSYQELSAIQLNTSGGGMAFNLSSSSGVGNTGDFWATTAVNVDMGSPTDWRDVFTAYYNAIHAKGSTGTGDFGAVTKSDPSSITGTGTITITYSAASVPLGGSAHEVGYPSGGYDNSKKPVLRQISGAGPLGGKVTGTINTSAVPSYSWSLVGTTLETSEDTSMARTKFNAGQIATGSAGGITGDSSKQLVLDFKDQLAAESSVASTMLIPLQGASSGDVKRASVADIIAAGIAVAGSAGAIQIKGSGNALDADNDFTIASNTMTVASGNSLDIASGASFKLAGTAVSSTAAELNILDGVTATAAELNLVDGISAGAVVASKAAMHTSDGSLLVTDEKYMGAVGDVDMLQFTGGSSITVASDLDLIVSDGKLKLGSTAVTATAAELNIMDGVTSTTAELNLLDGSVAANNVDGKAAIVGSSGAFAVAGNLTVAGNMTINGTTTTVNSTTVTVDDPIFTLGGDSSPSSDDNKDRGIEFKWHNGSAAKVGFFGFDDSTGYFSFIPDASNSSEVFSGTKGDIDINAVRVATGGVYINGAQVTSTAAELNILDGVTATAAELNILDGVTATAAELNILDGVTSTAAELNILDGVTSTAAELNLLDGISAGAVVASKAAMHTSDGSLLVTDDKYIGAVGDPDMLQFDGGSEINVASDLDFNIAKAGGLQIAGAAVTSTAAELNLVDGISAGAVVASKAAMHNSAGSLLVSDDAYVGAVGDIDMLQFDAGNDITVASDLDLIVSEGKLKLGSTAVTSTAAELNILDGATVTAAELNIMDGDTSASATTLVDADRLVCNDAGTMKQVAMTDISDYIAGRHVQVHYMRSASGHARAVEGSVAGGSRTFLAGSNSALSATPAANTFLLLDGTSDEPHPQSTEQLEVYLNGQLLVGYHQGSASAYDYAYSADIDGSGNPGIALKPEGQALGHSDAAILTDDVIVLKYIKA